MILIIPLKGEVEVKYVDSVTSSPPLRGPYNGRENYVYNKPIHDTTVKHDNLDYFDYNSSITLINV